ncbi:CHAT domain-containing protein [Chitinophaga japonensis]|uniref:CHAT domain-containing protein n=2 Tax=Chitinophaga japonensis TaxID=104662 RepID=A0A562T2A2_CHIJA|nr:CHAT domain-containing protein [Chitinophaga japonensis]
MREIVAVEQSNEPPAQSMQKLQRLLSLHIRCSTARDSIRARILHRLGSAYRATGDVEKAIRYAREAADINSAGTPGAQRSFLTHSLFNLGLYYERLYLLAEANSYFDSCITVGLQFPEKTYIALMAYERKAFCFWEAADYQKSIETADKGILLAREMKDTSFEVSMMLQKAQAQLYLDDVAAAESTMQQPLRFFTSGREISDERLAVICSIYGRLLGKKKSAYAAITYYRKAIALNLRCKNLIQAVRNIIDLGYYIYDRELNNPQRAIACYMQGIELARQAKDAYLLSGLYNNVGALYAGRKAHRKALLYYQKGLAAMPIPFKDTVLQHNPSTDMLKMVGNDYFVYTLLANKAEAMLELYRTEGDASLLHAALGTFRVADKMVDQMRRRQYSEHSKLFWREKIKGMYEMAIETCYQLDRPEMAFFFFERSRAILLNDKLNELGAQKYLAPSDVARERQLRVKLFSLRQQLSILEESTPAYNMLRQQLFATAEELEKYLGTLEEKYPVYYQYKYDTTVYTVGDIRARCLRDNQSLVEYFNSDSLIYTLMINADTITLSKHHFKNYNAVVRELLALCSDKSTLNLQYIRYRQLAGQLHDSLFRPLHIPPGRVIISQDDQFVPFELLLTDPAVSTSFLLKKYVFSYTYSASYLMRYSDESMSLQSSLLGIAPVHYESRLQKPALADADRSLKKIASHFSSATFLIKEAATKRRFFGSLPLYPIVHLYSHADADSLVQEPVIYFRDSTLRLTELQLLGNVQTKMIVLSACNTGTGKNIRGEGIFSLARGFAGAGIPMTVTNLWQIDNKATYQLMELFYKYLNEGMDGDEALNKAKLEFLQQNDRTYELPYFWASCIFIGKAGKLQQEKKTATGKLKYGIAVALAIILGLAIFYRYGKMR